MKEREPDLENGNSDDLYLELSQTLGVHLPQENVLHAPQAPYDQSDPSHHPPQHGRHGGGLSIVTQSPNTGNWRGDGAGAGVGGGDHYGYGQSYHNGQGQDRAGYHPPAQPIYGQTNNQYYGGGRSNNSSMYHGHDTHNEEKNYYNDYHGDSHSVRSRRPEQLRQRDLDKAKAERMEKRKKVPKADNEEPSRCPSIWVAFSRMVTCCFPPPLLHLMGKEHDHYCKIYFDPLSCVYISKHTNLSRFFLSGKHTAEIQQAWREKVALVSIIFFLCFSVGFLTFGFNVVLCGKEPNRIRHGHVDENSAVLLGRAYLLKDFNHPAAPGIQQVTSNLLAKPFPDAGGKDMTFMFQNINMACKGVLNGRQHDQNGNVWNYFPCAVTSAGGSGTKPIGGLARQGCHLGPESIKARQFIKQLRFMGEVYFSWEDIKEPDTNYAVYNGNVLDLNRIGWLEDNIVIPPGFGPFMNGSFAGKDISLSMSYTKERSAIIKCLVDIVKVGVIDQLSLGCVVADIVLYVSLIVILSVVLLRFFLAVIFGWVLSWRLGSFDEKTFADKLRRQEIIEAWVDDNTSPYVDSPNSETNR